MDTTSVRLDLPHQSHYSWTSVWHWGELNVTSHAVDSPVRLVSCQWQYLLLSAPLCRVRELVSERARSEGEGGQRERERGDGGMKGVGGGGGAHAHKGMGRSRQTDV